VTSSSPVNIRYQHGFPTKGFNCDPEEMPLSQANPPPLPRVFCYDAETIARSPHYLTTNLLFSALVGLERLSTDETFIKVMIMFVLLVSILQAKEIFACKYPFAISWAFSTCVEVSAQLQAFHRQKNRNDQLKIVNVRG